MSYSIKLLCALMLGLCGVAFATQPLPNPAYVYSYPEALPDDVNTDESDLLSHQEGNLGLILKVAQFDASGSSYKLYADSYCQSPPFGPFFNGCPPKEGSVYLNKNNFLALLNGTETDSSPYTTIPSTLFDDLESNNLATYFLGVVTDFETTNQPIAPTGSAACNFYNDLITHFNNKDGLSVGITINPNPADFDASSAQCLNEALLSDPNHNNYYIIMIYGESENSITNAISLIGTSAPYRFAIGVDGGEGADECTQISNIAPFTTASHPNYKGIFLYQYKGSTLTPLPTNVTEALAMHCS